MVSATQQQRRSAQAIERTAVEAADAMHALLAANDAAAVRPGLVGVLAILTRLRDEADGSIDRTVAACRRVGMSWDEIGQALGITRQAAHGRFRGAANTTTGTRRAPRKAGGTTA